MKKKRRKLHRIQIFRRIVLAFFIVLVTFMAVMHQLAVPGFGPIDALCPFGGIETLYTLMTGQGFLMRTFSSNMFLLAGTIILGILLARFFCGWLCMFGGLQEYFAILGRKIFRKNFVLPERIDKPLRYTKYIVLVVILYFTWKAADLIIRPYDPFVAYAHLAAGLRHVWDEFAIGLIILVVSMIGSMFYDRVFCKYLCPLGAFLGILHKVSFYRIKREESTCTDCKICDKRCPVNINVSVKPAVKSAECINCMVCVTDCPTKKSTLKTTVGGKVFRPLLIAIAGVVIYVGIIGAAKITGKWESAFETLEEKAAKGNLSPDDIKGSNTLEDVVQNFGLDIDELYKLLGISADIIPVNTHLNEIKYLIPEYEISTEEVRIVVRELLGISSEPVVEDIQETDESNKTDFELEGTMTLNEVATMLGVPAEQVADQLGLPDDIPFDIQLREMQKDYGYTMPGLKERFRNITWP